MTSSTVLKALALQYWRYDRQCPVVALEYDNSDVLAITPDRRLIETEVKVSINDLRRDKLKVKHMLFREGFGLDVSNEYPEWAGRRRARAMYPGLVYPNRVSEFHFVLDPEIADEGLLVCLEMYPYAGVFTAKLYLGQRRPGAIRQVGDLVQLKKAHRIPKAARVLTRTVVEMVKGQSATLTRLALAGCSAAKDEDVDD